MPVTLYGDGSLYGDNDAIYGRISPELAAAQLAHVRETALSVIIKDERLNAWELVTGEDFGGQYYKAVQAGQGSIWELGFWSYRGTADIIQLDNGDIIRVRNGSNTDVNDRQIWIQTITDPTVTAQWDSWSVLYSGTHYSVSIAKTGANTYAVYHAKSDGLYRNNSLVWSSPDTATYGDVLNFVPVVGSTDEAGFLTYIRHDVTEGPLALRTMDIYYTPDIVNVDPEPDRTNFRWTRQSIASMLMDDGRVCKIQVHPLLFNPRSLLAGFSVFNQFYTSVTNMNATQTYIIRGLGGGGGKNWYSSVRLSRLSDGYFYMILAEVHQVAKGQESTTDIGGIFSWSRSLDGLHWSEPVVGPPFQRFVAGLVEDDNYVYWCGNDSVWRRPKGTEYDISNYVPKLSMDLPRDNQTATGEALIANPNNINNYVRNLADQEIVIRPGLKLPSGAVYEYGQFDRFWIKQVNQIIEGGKNQLQIGFGNILDRLDNKLRDVYNFVGVTKWEDWKAGKRNEAFNYYFETDTRPTKDDNDRLRTRGYCLWTGWRGVNFDITVKFSGVSGQPSVLGRYVDKRNHMKLRKEGSNLRLYEVVDNVENLVDGASVGTTTTTFTVRWVMEWGYYKVYFNGSLAFQSSGPWLDMELYKPGYVGFHATSYKISNFKFNDLEYPLKMSDLIKTALALGDAHDVIVSGGTSEAFGITWGPQTDIETAADGLRAAMETDKLQMVWRNGSLEIGKFNDTSIVKTIEDRLIESERADEPNRRINYSIVDGNEHSWIALDIEDHFRRGRSIVDYQDLPELRTQDEVKERAREAIRKSTLGASPGGTTPLYFDIYRMDHVLWTDNAGNEDVVRVEGMEIEIDQDSRPAQRVRFDNSLIADDPTEIVIEQVILEQEPSPPTSGEDDP